MTVVLPLLAVAGWVTIALMSYLNPSRTVPALASGLEMTLVAVFGGIVVALLLFALQHWSSLPRKAHLKAKSRRRRRFLFSLFFGLAATLLMAAGAAKYVHRDFHSYYAQLLMLFASLFLLKLDSLELIVNRQRVYAALYTGALVLFSLLIGWIMLMSYAIVTRAEPRWIEATAYNVVNGLIALLFLWSAATLTGKARREVRVSGNTMWIDEREISEILSDQEWALILAFLTAGGQARNCMQLSRVMAGEGGNGDLSTPPDRCANCVLHDWSPSKCGHYRNIKNRINDAKKYLELLHVGTIVPASPNLRDVKEAGWRLRFFDDVRLSIDKTTNKPARAH